MEIKILAEKVKIGEYEDLRFEYFLDGKNIHSWWLGDTQEGRELIPITINMFGEVVKSELRRFVDDR